MTLRIRQIIVIAFFAAFIIIGAVMLLYTSGYNFNLQKKKIEQVGVLLINAKPTGSQLYLNDELQTGDSPWRFNNLHPNFYSVKIDKTGYYPWQKKLEIKPKASTLAYNIVLFKKTLPVNMVSGSVEAFSFSPDEDKFVFANANGQIFLSERSKNTLIGQTDSPPIKFDWSSGGDLALLTLKSLNYSIIDITNPDYSLNLNKITPNKFSALVWSPTNDHLLYGLSSKTLYKINILTKNVKKITDEVEDFTFAGNNLYLLKKTVLAKYNPISLSDPFSVIDTLPAHQYSFAAGFKNYLLIKNQETKILFLKNLDNNKEPLLALTGTAGVWNQTADKNYLFYYNESEIAALDLDNLQTTLVGRYSSDLHTALPVNGAPYVILHVDKALSLAELDDRDHRNVEQIFSGKNIRNLWLDQKGANLYFLDEIGQEKGIFKLELR